MTLLLNSNIDQLLMSKICDNVARIGGSVNQLVNYKQCQVIDINLPDGGYGEVNKIELNNVLPVIKKYLEQEWNYLLKGSKISRDRKTLLLDVHDAYKNDELIDQFDVCISSNAVEHSPNPIWFLLNTWYLTKKDGYQYHAIPHFKYTYDCFREPTPIEHILGDFQKMTTENDTSHNEDYYQSAVVKHGWQKEFHEKYPINYPYKRCCKD